MKDLGIQQRTVDAAQEFSQRAPQHPCAALARSLVLTSLQHGAFADETATAADNLYLALRRLDTDGDGNLTPVETANAEDAQKLLVALMLNDRDGDGDLEDEVSTQPVSAKPTATPAVATPSSPPTFMDIGRRVVGLTIWSSRGVRYAFEKSRYAIERIRPDFVTAHGDPVAMSRAGREFDAYVKSQYAWLRTIWAGYGDSYGPNPARIWAAFARAAQGFADSVQPNCEVAWKSPSRGTHKQRNAIARESALAMRVAAPLMHLSFTSYDGWVSVPRPDGQGRWGGHEAMPIDGFLGNGTPINAESAQVYIGGASDGTGALYVHAVSRYARHEASRQAAIRKRLVSPAVEPWMYLQVHSSRPDAIVYLSERRRVTQGWAGPSRIDENGILGLAAARELALRGETVESFQRAAKLKVDGRCGPMTLGALNLK